MKQHTPILIKCDLCGILFNPGNLLDDEYPDGFIALCDDCYETSEW